MAQILLTAPPMPPSVPPRILPAGRILAVAAALFALAQSAYAQSAYAQSAYAQSAYAQSAYAQPPEQPRRPGVERQVVVQLAYALGQAHALRRLCAGPADATWYARMQRLEAEEASDEASRRQLVESFNAGFAAEQAEFAACGRRSRAAERSVAERGGALAARLAGAD